MMFSTFTNHEKYILAFKKEQLWGILVQALPFFFVVLQKNERVRIVMLLPVKSAQKKPTLQYNEE